MEQKDFIKDGLDNNQIIEIVKKIRKTIEYEGSGDYEFKKKNLEIEFDKFNKRYPMLFDMAIRKEPFDWNSFNYFMNMRQKIINDEITSEKASVSVGQKWFDDHIDKKKLKKRKTKEND